MHSPLLILVLLAAVVAVFPVYANPPVLKSGTPVIYLADNLDEKDRLGWCIDTEGRGYAEKLQAHSCKPKRAKPSDTQFRFDRATSQIQSVPFVGKCMTLTDANDKVWPFGLRDCKAGDETQSFEYDVETMEIRLGTDPSACVVVVAKSIIAGPFMSRDLVYAKCAATASKYKQWVVKP